MPHHRKVPLDRQPNARLHGAGNQPTPLLGHYRSTTWPPTHPPLFLSYLYRHLTLYIYQQAPSIKRIRAEGDSGPNPRAWGARKRTGTADVPPKPAAASKASDEVEVLKRKIQAMQKKLSDLENKVSPTHVYHPNPYHN